MDLIKGNDGQDGKPQKIKLHYAEDLPQEPGGITLMFSACHKIRALHVGWDSEQRVLSLFCSECGAPVSGIKVESKGRIIKV